MAWQPLNPPSLEKPRNYSQGVKAGNVVFVSGQTSRDKNGKPVTGDMAVQTDRIYQRLSDVLAAGGASLKDVLRSDMFRAADAPGGDTAAVREKYLGKGQTPPGLGVTVPSVIDPGVHLCVEVMAGIGEKESLNPSTEFKAPFAQGIKFGNWVVTAGQASRRGDGSVLEGDLVIQTRRIYEKIVKILAAGGATWADIVQIHIFNTRAANQSEGMRMPEMRAAFVPAYIPSRPARGVNISALAVPQFETELEFIAVLGKKEVFNSPKEWTPGFINHVCRVENWAFTSGMTARAKDGNLVGSNDIVAQTKKVYEKLANQLDAAGLSLRNVVKLNTFITPKADAAKYWETRAQYFPANQPQPAETLVNCKALALPDMVLELDAVAYAG
ncbi:MAG: hypothetical protein HY683_07915 [Chloroflexi bacterium]|nr:hypothetical protein [Chloroflexota bacterium]